MSKLTAALTQYFGGYAKHFLVGENKVPEFEATEKNGVICLQVAGRTITRRAGAYLLLAGGFWASVHKETHPVLVASLTAHPMGGLNTWSTFDDFQLDDNVVQGLTSLAECIDHTEGILLLRRALEVDDCWFDAAELPNGVPAVLRTAVGEPSPLISPLASKSSFSGLSVAKVGAPGALSEEPRERLAAAVVLAGANSVLNDNHLSFLKVVEPALMALLADGDGAAYEVALGVAQSLSMNLLSRRAYPEAKRLLDLVVPVLNLAELFRSRWECRIYLGDEHAEQDWQAADALDPKGETSYLGPCMFWSGDVLDRRGTALARAAAGQVARAIGDDPCQDRKVTKKSKPNPEQAKELLRSAETLINESLAIAEPRAQADVAKARSGESVQTRGFQADAFAARAQLLQARGDLLGALNDFRLARKVRSAGGLSWQSDWFGDDIRRLEEACGEAKDETVPAFDIQWIADAKRNAEELEVAASRWDAEPWRTFPPPALPFLVVEHVVAYSGDYWEAAQADGIELGDRIAFIERARGLLDRWAEQQDAICLEKNTRFWERTVFDMRTGLRFLEPSERKPILSWVQTLTQLEPIDETTVLPILEKFAFERLRDIFHSVVDILHEERDLFDALRGAGLSGTETASVLRAYIHLFHNDWSRFGVPKPDWLSVAKPLQTLNTNALATALIAWTRARQAAVDPDGSKFPLHAKWLWPLHFCWCPEAKAFADDVREGRLDNKRLSKTQVKARAECLEWLGQGS